MFYLLKYKINCTKCIIFKLITVNYRTSGGTYIFYTLNNIFSYPDMHVYSEYFYSLRLAW